MSRLILILGDCLYPDHSSLNIQKDDIILMAETSDLATHFTYHKHKILLFFSAMRSHADTLKNVIYHTYDGKSYEQVLEKVIKKKHVTEIVTYTIEDKFFDILLQDFCKKNNLDLSFRDKPGFLTTKKEFKEWLGPKKNPLMANFYKWQRQRLKILVDKDGKPQGDKWSFDEDNRKKLPKDYESPEIAFPKWSKHTREVSTLVYKQFSNHPGKIEDFYLPTTRKQALDWLDDFLEKRFHDFGPYEDAFDSDEVFISHSVLSPLLNCGLLTPKEVVDKSLTYAKEHDIPINSLEGFIRQIIGWREFIRGVYHTLEFEKNYFNHKRKLTKDWYEGTTGIVPLDDTINKANKYGYVHHIERLMIAGNMMLLCEIDPDDVYAWFMELFVDSADWVMLPNVYGMSQFADGGSFATKPYIGGSNYIRKMSSYSKDDWCDVMDGLYWRFIKENRTTFANNQRMSMMVSLLDKMDSDRKKKIFTAAENFLSEKTA